ncbi:MAG: histone deacetylase [bacterium]
MPFIYSAKYYADIGLHVFPVIKYRLIYDRLTGRDGGASTDGSVVSTRDFLSPEPASEKELLLVHTPEYLDDLRNCRWTERTAYSELPITPEIVHLFELACGGTILASRQAVQKGWAVHLSGGFHHTFADKAEGFCYLNDLAVAARVMQNDNVVEKVAVIDCDLHQGNGTAKIFHGDETVYTFSIHQGDLYPVKQESDWDIHLPMHVEDEDYLRHLHHAIPRILDDFRPELVLYQAGADPYKNDQLGSLALTIEGLQARDQFIFRECKKRALPVAVTLGGGYAYNTNDTVQIHLNTCKAALEVVGRLRNSG